jgi:hypothetical protein
LARTYPPDTPSRHPQTPLPNTPSPPSPGPIPGMGSELEPGSKKSRKKWPPRARDPPRFPHGTDAKTLVTLGPKKNVNLAHTYTLVGAPGSTSQTPLGDTSQTLQPPLPDPPGPGSRTPVPPSPPPLGWPSRMTLGGDPGTLPGTLPGPSPDPPGTLPGTLPRPSPGPSRDPPGTLPGTLPRTLPGTLPGIARKPGIGRFPRNWPKPAGKAGFETGTWQPMGNCPGGVPRPTQAIPGPSPGPSPDPPQAIPGR